MSKNIPIDIKCLRNLSQEEINDFSTGEYFLSDLLVYVNEEQMKGFCFSFPFMEYPRTIHRVKEFPSVIYIPVDQGPYYQILTKDMNMYDIYKMYCGTQHKGLKINYEITIESIKHSGYDHNRLIVIDKQIKKDYGIQVIRDGHHRASILYYLHGDMKVKVGEVGIR